MSVRTILIACVCLLRLFSAHAQSAEKVLISTDKQWYYAGETIRFSVNVLDACTNKPVATADAVFIELVGSVSAAAAQDQVEVVESSGSGYISVDNNLPSGVYRLRAYTNAMKHLPDDRLSEVMIRLINPARPAKIAGTKQVNDHGWSRNDAFGVSTLNTTPVYGKREKLTLAVSAREPSTMSISIFRTDSLETGECNHQEDLFSRRCADAGINALENINDHKGTTITGRIVDKRTQSPVPGVRGYLTILGAPQFFYNATSDSNGLIRFFVDRLVGSRELLLQTNPLSDSNYVINLESPFRTPSATKSEKGDWDVIQSHPVSISDALTALQVQRRFSSHARSTVAAPAFDTTPFYGIADEFHRVGDYVRFSTVEEILREYVTTVGVQNRRGKPVPLVHDVVLDRLFDKPPLILVDGVPLFEVDRLMEMNPDDLKSIAVVARRFYMGYDSYAGILDVRLHGRLTELPRNATVVDFSGLQELCTFQSVEYSSAAERANRRPDFRTVLFWSPNMEVGAGETKQISAYTSDLEGKYVVVLHGVSMNGEPGCKKIFFEVR